MTRSKFSLAMAHLVMEAISHLQRSGQRATTRDIREHIAARHADAPGRCLDSVPKYILKGVNLGLITRYGDNYRTSRFALGQRTKRKRVTRARRARPRAGVGRGKSTIVIYFGDKCRARHILK